MGVDTESAWAVTRPDQRGLRRGVRVRRDGTVSVWSELPSDGLGQIFDPEDITGRIRTLLLLGSEASSGATSDQLAPAVSVAPIQFLVEDRIHDLGRRNSATIGSPRHALVRVEPEESIPRESLPAAAEEIAQELTARLTQTFRGARR